MFQHLSEYDVQKLYKASFILGQYDHIPKIGSVYFHDGNYYTVGGIESLIPKEEFSKQDRIAALEGVWLPSDSHLWCWLQQNHIDCTLTWNAQEEEFQVSGTDQTSGAEFHGCNTCLLYALYKLIYKICKSGSHKFEIPISSAFEWPEYHISYEEMQKLKRAGFSFPDYEHYLNYGMIYAWENGIHTIGGSDHEPHTMQDQLIAESGCWLPDDSQLWEWLYRNGFDVTFQWREPAQLFQLSVTDSLTAQSYASQNKILVYALSDLIYRICDSKRRNYIPCSNLKLEITGDYIN